MGDFLPEEELIEYAKPYLKNKGYKKKNKSSFKPTLLLRAEGWRPSDRKCKHLNAVSCALLRKDGLPNARL